MRQQVVFIMFLYFFSICYSQKSELYLVLDDTTHVYQMTMIQNDTLQLKYIQIQKDIPREKYLFRLYLDSNNEVQKSIPANNSWGMEETIGNMAVFCNKKILKSDIENFGNRAVKSSQIHRIEFESLRNVMDTVDDLYFLLDDELEEEYYYLSIAS